MADVRVTDLPLATSLADQDVLHGVQNIDTTDKRFELADLKTFLGASRVIAGGLFNTYDPLQPGPTINNPGTFEPFTGPLQAYTASPASNVTLDLLNGRIQLDMAAPIPTTNQWVEIYATVNWQSPANNQVLGLGLGDNNGVNTNTIVQSVRESPNDTEQVMLHGHVFAPNLAYVQLFMTNYTTTQTPLIQSVNMRVFGRI